MNDMRTTDNWKRLFLFNEKDTIIFCVPDTWWFLDYSADGDSLVEQVPHCSEVSLSLNYRSSAAVWVHCQSSPIVYARNSDTLSPF